MFNFWSKWKLRKEIKHLLKTDFQKIFDDIDPEMATELQKQIEGEWLNNSIEPHKTMADMDPETVIKLEKKIEDLGLPTAIEINPYHCFDGNIAEKNFLGKTIEEIVDSLNENEAFFYDDYIWMGPIAFNYYLPAIEKYLSLPDVLAKSEIPDFLHSTFELRLDNDLDKIKKSFPMMLNICNFILNNVENLHFQSIENFKNQDKPRYQKLQNKLSELINSDLNALKKYDNN